MCFVDVEKAFDGDQQQVMEWTMRKKGLLEVVFQGVLSLHVGSKTRVRVRSAYSGVYK